MRRLAKQTPDDTYTSQHDYQAVELHRSLAVRVLRRVRNREYLSEVNRKSVLTASTRSAVMTKRLYDIEIASQDDEDISRVLLEWSGLAEAWNDEALSQRSA